MNLCLLPVHCIREYTVTSESLIDTFIGILSKQIHKAESFDRKCSWWLNKKIPLPCMAHTLATSNCKIKVGNNGEPTPIASTYLYL
ncbi:hypothetical protein QQP08_007597 [Theobroma cacao]|nr:hypothetical protein QQP08_007597 [Theobroma cacao]